MSKIKFSMITEKLKYPPLHKGKLQQLHSEIINYGIENFDGDFLTRVELIKAINACTHIILSGDTLPTNNDTGKFIQILQSYSDIIDTSLLGPLYLDSKSIDWDIPIVKDSKEATSTEDMIESRITPSPVPPSKHEVQSEKNSAVKATSNSTDITKLPLSKPEFSFKASDPTPRSDILLSTPQYPQLDTSRIFAEDTSGPNHLVIYYSLPEIPTCQREISVTTDINKMRDTDLMRMFPNRIIKVRNKDIYTYPAPELEIEPNLGYIIPVEGFTRKQLIDNMIRYPQLIKLRRMVDGQMTNFCDNIEIDGTLFNTLDVWDTLPESDKIPRISGFVIEYVARRYLLERDIKHIEHRYPLIGSLDPFLTLFMSPNDYSKYGYKNSLQLAKDNVNARVSYKTTRNPILRRIESVRMSIQS